MWAVLRVIFFLSAVLLFIWLAWLILGLLSGEGGLKGRLTLGGIYAVCKPEGYDSVCFVNKSTGGISCHPYSGECR